MLWKLWDSPNRQILFRSFVRVLSLSLWVGAVFFLASTKGKAQSDRAQNGGWYFGGEDLDFWREGKRVQDPLRPKAKTVRPPGVRPIPAGSSIRQNDSLPFDWSKYQNPSSLEFWDDGGDYVPPRPLREAVSNPTPENLKNYLEWQAKRITVIAQFNANLAQMSPLSALSAPHGENETEPAQENLPLHRNAPVAWHELDLLYFYQSSCPHCQAEKAHVEALGRRGVRIHFVQLDAKHHAPLHTPSVPYSAALHKQFAVSATPTWIFRRREKVLRLQGAQDPSDLDSQLSRLFSFSPKPIQQRSP